MSPLTSTLSCAGTKRMRALPTTARRTAAGYLSRMVESVRSVKPETFYQNHVIAIFLGMFLETAMGPLLGIVGGYLFNHWMM